MGKYPTNFLSGDTFSCIMVEGPYALTQTFLPQYDDFILTYEFF